MFTSLFCPNNCDQRQLTVAEALYNFTRTTLEAEAMNVWDGPWDDLEDEARQFFLKLAGAAIKALNP